MIMPGHGMIIVEILVTILVGAMPIAMFAPAPEPLIVSIIMRTVELLMVAPVLLVVHLMLDTRRGRGIIIGQGALNRSKQQ